MNLNPSHLLIAFLACLTATVVLALVPGNGDIGGQVGLIDTLGGLTVVLAGAIAGSQIPKQ